MQQCRKQRVATRPASGADVSHFSTDRSRRLLSRAFSFAASQKLTELRPSEDGIGKGPKFRVEGELAPAIAPVFVLQRPVMAVRVGGRDEALEQRMRLVRLALEFR